MLSIIVLYIVFFNVVNNANQYHKFGNVRNINVKYCTLYILLIVHIVPYFTILHSIVHIIMSWVADEVLRQVLA
jgi:hypothetical protein